MLVKHAALSTPLPCVPVGGEHDQQSVAPFLSRLMAVPTGVIYKLEPWSRVRVVGMVEDYREKVFKKA